MMSMFDGNREPDDRFEPGTLAHLVPGNRGRVLDGRRTPGFVESYDPDSATFLWHITGYEDEGLCWEMPAEYVNSFQFQKDCPKLPADQVKAIQAACNRFAQRLHIPLPAELPQSTRQALEAATEKAAGWLRENSCFFQEYSVLPLSAPTGAPLLYDDLQNYLSQNGLLELEQRTAGDYVLNPWSGEWLKGMKIVLAELGLIGYQGTIPRKPDMFSGLGDKERRRQYLLARYGFVQAMFRQAGVTEVPLYRGMASESDFFETPSSLLSATFSPQTALEFASLPESPNEIRSSYCVKFTCPVSDLFMTFLETRQLNEKHQEQEAILFYHHKLLF